MARRTRSTQTVQRVLLTETAAGVQTWGSAYSSRNDTWETTALVNGRYVTQAPMTRQVVTRRVVAGRPKTSSNNFTHFSGDISAAENSAGALQERVAAQQAAYNGAYARFVTKVKQGAVTQLGMAFAGRKQTAELLRTYASRAARLSKQSYTDLLGWFTDWLARWSHAVRQKQWRRLKGLMKDKAEKLSSEVLAFKFGFMPLVEDVTSAAKELVRYKPEGLVIKGRRYEKYRKSWKDTGVSYSAHGTARACISARCVISNDNLALANRMGLVNPAVLAWDIVPWSWVVGMFANVSQYLGAFTDLVGYRIWDSSTTQHYRTVSIIHDPGSATRTEGWCTVVNDFKKRTISSVVTRPSFMWHVPTPSVGLAVTALALAGQRLSQYGRLIDKIKSFRSV